MRSLLNFFIRLMVISFLVRNLTRLFRKISGTGSAPSFWDRVVVVPTLKRVYLTNVTIIERKSTLDSFQTIYFRHNSQIVQNARNTDSLGADWLLIRSQLHWSQLYSPSPAGVGEASHILKANYSCFLASGPLSTRRTWRALELLIGDGWAWDY